MIFSRRIFCIATIPILYSSPTSFGYHEDTLPEGPPEAGFGLTMEEATSGWLSLFDSTTDYGWIGGKVSNNSLIEGSFSLPLTDCKLKLSSKEKSSILLGDKIHHINPNNPAIIESSSSNKILKIESGSLKEVSMFPLNLKTQFNGKDLSGWKEIIRKGKSQAKWQIADGKISATGGPAALELENQLHANMIIRIKVSTKARHSNGGVFFRCIPGDFMNGYEAQIYNRCDENNPAKPTKWATGAIDDRMQARRLISRDFQPFSMTVIAHGPKIAVWVNGFQTVSWIDTREKSDNPRKGLRIEAGSIQIQSHDPMTNMEIHEFSSRNW